MKRFVAGVHHGSFTLMVVVDGAADDRATAGPLVLLLVGGELDAFVQQRVTANWSGFVAAGGGDAFTRFTQPVALETIGHVIGIPPAEAHQLMRWTQDSQNYFGRMAPGAPGSPGDLAAMDHLLGYFRTCLAEALARGEETIAGNIARLGRDGELTEREMTHMCLVLLLAGGETTASSMLAGMIRLTERPELLNRLAANDADVLRFVSEVIRFDGPAQRLVRVATRDAELGGVAIPRGTSLRFLVGSADRDERRFANGDAFDMDRKAAGPIFFGLGVHACLGMHLARQELTTAFRAVAGSSRTLSLDPKRPIDYLEGGSMGVSGPISATFTV